MSDLQGKTILITGASQGIGRAIGLAAAQQGARLILVARHREGLQEVLQELPGGPHRHEVVDVSSAESVDQLAKNLTQLDGLVNNAGIYGPIGPLGEISMADFEAAIAINFLGTVRMSQACLPFLLRSSRGKIVNLSGGGAATPFPQYSAYATSKVAVVRFTENLALEYPNLDINCVAPGFVITRLHQQTLQAGPEKAGQAFYENTRKQVESGGVAPEVAAELITFLLGSASNGLTGRFLSAPWDPWRSEEFLAQLRQEPHLATLRRIDNKGFRAT